MKKILLFILFALFVINPVYSKSLNSDNKKVLIIVEGRYDLSKIPTAIGRETANLLGHFNTTVTIEGSEQYKALESSKFDFIFYIGYSKDYKIPKLLESDLFTINKPLFWINGGIVQFSSQEKFKKRYGFEVSKYLDNSNYSNVKTNDSQFTKGTGSINIINILDKNKVTVYADAISTSALEKPTPYFIKSGNLTYIADIPFIGAKETDRYLLFADKLHDFLGENHPESHKCFIRIEDINCLSNPNQLRKIADYLYSQNVPFMVGVVPIYVNPGDGTYIKMSEKPELVDALKYMVQKGGSIIMHGVTHQYKGVSTEDAEFWNMSTNTPIIGENVGDFSKRIEMGITELMKNDIFPIAWETPHYMGTVKAYTAISKHFSTVVEQRMAIDNIDYGQYFPYVIYKDLYGQKIYPENLGYVPLLPSIDSSMVFVDNIIKNSLYIKTVRDGVAGCFFHPFMDISLLEKIVKNFKINGFEFIDLKNDYHKVVTSDKIILNGPTKTTYTLNIKETYLFERYFNKKEEPIRKIESEYRIKDTVQKIVNVDNNELYVAEGVEFHIKTYNSFQKIINSIKSTFATKEKNENWNELRVAVCWNNSATGAAFNDQSSLISIFKSLNVNVDTLCIKKADININEINLLVVPNSVVDSLSYYELQNILHFVEKGGHLITDYKNKLTEELGFKSLSTDVVIQQVKDNYFPQENIFWYKRDRASKVEIKNDDEIFCEDASSGLPLVIGRSIKKGKIIYINTLFDPNSTLGYSRYPFILEYVKKYFNLHPVVKRENLEVYFDPGLRQNVSVENLVKQWVKEGIRIIHIAGWHQYPKYNYDYERVIKLAHSNGILVYAWLEPPQLNQKFWEKHPEWREKNYLGEDVRASWRYPLAITDSKCLHTMIYEYLKFLNSYDFDGVNLAELYFEAGLGFSEPKLFTPMHPSAVREFRKIYGFDLRQAFNKNSQYYWKINSKAKNSIINYRVSKITEIHNLILESLTSFAKKRDGFGIMVTFMDTYQSPEILINHGISSDAIVKLQNKYNFLIQPEDPRDKWNTTPARYVNFAKEYSSKIADSTKLLVDLNILSFRKTGEITPFPTLIQTGVESYQMINSASKGAPRFTIYSEGSCNPQDLFFFSYASSSMVKYEYTENGYDVSSPYSFVIHLPKNVEMVKVDDQEISGFRDNKILISAGEHEITLYSKANQFSTVSLQPQLLSCTGNVTNINYDMREVKFSYDSYERAYATFSRKPSKITVDGTNYKFRVQSGADCFSVMLPKGSHKVEVITGDQMTYDINLTSLWSISAIAVYGIIAVGLLVLLYFSLKLLRKRLEK